MDENNINNQEPEYRPNEFNNKPEKPHKEHSNIGPALLGLIVGAIIGVACVPALRNFKESSPKNKVEASEEEEIATKDTETVEETEEETKESKKNKKNIKDSENETKSEKSDSKEADRTQIYSGNASNGSVADIVENVMPSVVAVTITETYNKYDWFGDIQQYEGQGAGSGIIVDEDDENLYIATNNHVIDGADNITVQFNNGSSVQAKVNGSSKASDLAVITIDLDDIDKDTLKSIKVASVNDDRDSLRVGDQVIAIGNAMGYGQSITVGYISALDRTVKSQDGSESSDMIQTDAAINPGNSGGALINMNGEVIGINEAKLSATDVEGMGYSIPIYKVNDLIGALSSEQIEEKDQGSLGIQCLTVTDETVKSFDMPKGVFVYKITNDELVDAGLQEKDIITKIDNHSVNSVEDLMDYLSHYRAGDVVTLRVSRVHDGEYSEHEINCTLIKNVNYKEKDNSDSDKDSKSDDLPFEKRDESRDSNSDPFKKGDDSRDNNNDFDPYQDPFEDFFRMPGMIF